MEKIITFGNIGKFAYVNDGICRKPIKGIVLSFFGLGGADMYAEETPQGTFFGERGLLYVIPYNNPWAWMNRQAISFTDEILDVLFERYSLPDSLPVVSTGGSMGGQSALVYTRYAKRTPVLCVANCPVCDMLFHYTERADLPRTMYSAFFNEAGSAEEVLKRFSPLHLVPEMPKAKYRIFHCDEDRAVNMGSHSEKFVQAMKEAGHDVLLEVVHGRGHCDLTDGMWKKFNDYCVDAVGR